MPSNLPPGQAPMQGLNAAQPPAAPPGGGDPKQQLLQAAGTVLQDAVAQFGPQIVEVLTQLLTTAPPPGAGAPPSGPQIQ